MRLVKLFEHSDELLIINLSIAIFISLIHELLHVILAEQSPHHGKHLPQLGHVNVSILVSVKYTKSISENLKIFLLAFTGNGWEGGS